MIKTRYLFMLVVVLLILSIARLSPETDAAPAAPDGVSGTRSGLLLAADTEHKVFRRGYEGYAGVIDTYISRDTGPDVAHGGETNLHAKEGSWGLKRTIIKFDTTAIPYYMQVDQARLDLVVAATYGSGDWRVSVYRVNKDWVETATWNDMGADCSDATLIATQTYTRTAAYGGIDITALVQGWVADPLSNYGLLIKCGSTVDLRFYSSEENVEDRRPRLAVAYHVPAGVTPPPTLTPTFTPIPTLAPTGTPTPAATVVSYGKAQANGGECVVTAKDSPGSTQVLLLTRGLITEARLKAWHQNNNGLNTVKINGVEIGKLRVANGREKCTGTAGATAIEIPFPPSLLVDGLNTITAVTDAEWENDWSLESPSIVVGGTISTATIRKLSIRSSYDGNDQQSTVMLPIGHETGSAVRYPLLVVLHGWGGNDFEALKWMAQACNDAGWVLAAPWIRSGSQHTASLGAQHDIIDLVDHLLAAPESYAIDPNRVYLLGRSMGGMIAATTAAKYPDRFAALVEWQGPTDLAVWYSYLAANPREAAKILALEKDCGGAPTAAYLFDYQRRSVASMPMNLANLPTMIIHGQNDATVPVSHGENLYAGMMVYGPTFVDKSIYAGDHYAPDPPPDWHPAQIIAFFQRYTRNGQPERVNVRTDEPKSYYWLSLAYDNEVTPHWNALDARFDRNAQVVTVDARDERANPRVSFCTIDLAALGLPTGGLYTVEDKNLDTGFFSQSQQAPDGGRLRLRVGANHHHLTVYPQAAPPATEVDLYQGNMGYAGVSDTTLESNPAGDTHGAEDSLRVATSGTLARALLRFELAGRIPEGRVIKGAQLKLRTNYSWGGNRTVKTSLYRLLQPWDALQASWNQRLTGVAWSAGGAGSADNDHETTAYAAQTLTADGVTYIFNVTDLVQKWVSGQAPNYGMLLKGESGSATYKLNASEASTYRPELYVWYADPTATFTPTPTPTLTPSPTATRGFGKAYLPVIWK